MTDDHRPPSRRIGCSRPIRPKARADSPKPIDTSPFGPSGNIKYSAFCQQEPETPVKLISGKQALLFTLPVAASALVVALSGTAGAQQANKGEQIMNASCGGCHDLRPIQTSARDKEAWND